MEPIFEEERIRPPAQLPTLGRGRVFVQKAHDPAEIVDAPVSPRPEVEKTKRWPWVLASMLLFGSAGRAAYLYRDAILPSAKLPSAKGTEVPIGQAVRTELAQIAPQAIFFHTGPFDEPLLGDAYFAPDGRRYAFLYREGGESGLEGAGVVKTANMLELNGQKIHLGVLSENEATRARAGYFESTDRFWYLERIGDRERLILEDDRGEEFDRIGPPMEAPKDKQIGHVAKKGDRWLVVVGDWISPPYERPVFGPWFSPNGDAFSFLVGGLGDRAVRGDRQVVTCSIEAKTCDKRPNNPVRSIEEYLQVGSEDELFFALDWYATPSSTTVHENLEMMVISKRLGLWQYAVVTRATASFDEVPLGDTTMNLTDLAKRSEIERPWIERIVASPDGQSIAMVVGGRSYVAGDGVVVRRSKNGDVALHSEFVRCKFAQRPFARRDWLVMSADESRSAFCTHDPVHGERVVVDGLSLEPFTYIMSPPVFSPSGDTVAYFAIKDQKWFAIAGAEQDGPYDELFGSPRFSVDGSQVWYGARRGRTLFFVRWSLRPRPQADGV